MLARSWQVCTVRCCGCVFVYFSARTVSLTFSFTNATSSSPFGPYTRCSTTFEVGDSSESAKPFLLPPKEQILRVSEAVFQANVQSLLFLSRVVVVQLYV